MQNITCVLLIDKRLANYDEIIASANAVTACVVFDYELDTFDTLRTRGIDRITPENRVVRTWVADVEVESDPTTEPKQQQQQQQQQQQVREYHNIGLMQHNTNGSQYFAMANEPGCQLDNVAESDPSLETWANYIEFINTCVRDYGLQTYDMMACALYSDANWKYAIDEMTVRCGITIRASLDNTGAADLKGDWFLLVSNRANANTVETVDLTTIYFTDEILKYKFVLALKRISIPDFYASYGSDTSASSFTLNEWSIYSSVGTYDNEGLSNLIKPSATYVAGFLSDKVTIGITGPTPFRIDSTTWGADHLLNRTPKTVKMYGSNISYLGNISSSIISSNATLIDTFSFQRVSEQTITIRSTLYYSSYYFDVLDNWGDSSTKISGIVFMVDYTPATLTFNKTAFYVKYLLNSTISIPATIIVTNNSDSYTLAHSSGNPGIATITTSANVGTVTVKGIGTANLTSTLAATTNFDAVTVTSITITVIGSGSYVTGATMTSIDLTSTDLTGSVISNCDLTSADLYGATFNAATDLRGSTLTSLRSGRIIGFTTLLPAGYKMI